MEIVLVYWRQILRIGGILCAPKHKSGNPALEETNNLIRESIYLKAAYLGSLVCGRVGKEEEKKKKMKKRGFEWAYEYPTK